MNLKKFLFTGTIAGLAMGIALCWITAVFYLPAILKVIELIKARKGGRS